MSKFVATRMYLKPLLPAKKFKGDTDALLRRARKDLLRRIKARITQTAFSPRAKKALAKALNIELKPSSLVITANHPAFAPLVKGQRAGQMKWLRKAQRPIPIITDEGKLIYRWASARSMKNKKWIHPGRPPSDFVTRAKEESRVFLKSKIKEELKRQMRSALKK